MQVDLHTHSTASDGKLTPLELVERARASGVDLLAITDHDTTAGFDSLGDARFGSLRLVAGIELSAKWRQQTIHVVGLNIGRDRDAIHEAVAVQQAARRTRAGIIATRLAKQGLGNLTDRVEALASRISIGRPHIAEMLVESGAVRTVDEAFRKYLGSGRIGDVKDEWESSAQIIDWIRAAGGTAVIAHPEKYQLTRTRLRELIADFRAAGGEAIEVVSGRQAGPETRALATLCEQSGLSASSGSDFHQPGQHWAELGSQSAVPDGCRPVWERW